MFDLAGMCVREMLVVRCDTKDWARGDLRSAQQSFFNLRCTQQCCKYMMGHVPWAVSNMSYTKNSACKDDDGLRKEPAMVQKESQRSSRSNNFANERLGYVFVLRGRKKKSVKAVSLFAG
jgi:hypothetical protein